jgi:hypothetical protein
MGPKRGRRSRGCTKAQGDPRSIASWPSSAVCTRSPFAAAAIRLLLFIGCRLREIPHLKWEQVDVERGPPKSACSRGGTDLDHRVIITMVVPPSITRLAEEFFEAVQGYVRWALSQPERPLSFERYIGSA